MDNEQNKPITVFISYSWDSEEHKAWVKMLADRLTEEGLEVLLDQYEIAGNSLTSFMQDGIAKADKVIIVGTPRYKEKANSHKCGTKIEDQIINIHMGRDFTNPKFIPVLRSGGFEDSFTVMVSDRFGFDFSDDAKFESEFERLVGGLYGKSKRPEKKHEIQWTISLNEKQISGIYFGPLKSGKPEGSGHFIGKEVDYKGEFREGLFHGQGKISWSKELFLEGIFVDGLFISGRGKRNWPYNEEGEFIDGKLSGNGKRFIDGGFEKGEFKDGELHGEGKRMLDENVFEEGEFINGKLNGFGKRTMYDDEVEEGEFKDGELHGKGKRTYPDGRVEEGEYEFGKLHKNGKITYPNGRVEVGEFDLGKLHGQGKRTYPDGRVVEEGEFREGKLDGQGKRTNPTVSIEEGEFRRGVLYGKGKRIYSYGLILMEQGDFKDGDLYGQGKRIYPDGSVEEGEFKYGKLIKKKQ